MQCRKRYNYLNPTVKKKGVFFFYYFLNLQLLFQQSDRSCSEGSMLQKHFALSTKNPLVNYDALQDKHASFYFNGYGVKKHLKKLKKALQKQPFQKGYKQYAQMLNHKLTQLQQSKEEIHHKTKPYVQTLKQSSLQKLQKAYNFNANGNIKNHLIKDQENHQKKTNISFQNLPNISKYKMNHLKNSLNPSYDMSGQEKINKSLSSVSKLDTISQKKGNSANLIKQRNNKSVQGSTKKYKNTSSKNDKVFQVKHQDFMSFLKKRQDDILSASKAIIPINQTALIKVEVSPSEES